MAGKHKTGAKPKKAGASKAKKQQSKFAMAAKEASRRVKKDPRLDFQVQMKELLKK